LQRIDTNAAGPIIGSPSDPVVLPAAPAPSQEAVYAFADAPASPGAPPARQAPASAAQIPLKNFLREQELAYLNRALTQAGGDKEKAAEMLGISLATLYRKMAGETE